MAAEWLQAVRLGLAVKIFLPACFTASVRLDWRGARVAARRQVRLGLAVKIFLPACFTASVRLDWRGGRCSQSKMVGKTGLSTSPSRVAARRQVRLGLAVKIFLPACFTASVRLDWRGGRCSQSKMVGKTGLSTSPSRVAARRQVRLGLAVKIFLPACFTASVRLDWRGGRCSQSKMVGKTGLSTSSRVAARRQVRLGLAVKIFLPACFTASVRLDWRGGRCSQSKMVGKPDCQRLLAGWLHAVRFGWGLQ